MDSPSDAASRGIQYSAVMGEQLWRLIGGNTLQVRESKYPFDGIFLTLFFLEPEYRA